MPTVNEVVCDPSVRTCGVEAWRVYYRGWILTPTFNSKGAAAAYLALVEGGHCLPEFPPEADRTPVSR